MARKPLHLFRGQFIQADQNGHAIRYELPYPVEIRNDVVMLADCRIAMSRILLVEPQGAGVALTYRNSIGQPIRLILTSDHLFGWMRRRRIQSMIRAIRMAQGILLPDGMTQTLPQPPHP